MNGRRIATLVRLQIGVGKRICCASTKQSDHGNAYYVMCTQHIRGVRALLAANAAAC